MKKASFIVFDVETGGFSNVKNPITQIAFMVIDSVTFKERERVEFFIKPYDDLVIGAEALEATGLKMSEINKGLEKEEAVEIIIDLLKKSMPNNHPSNKPTMIGHNVSFDIGFLKSLFERCKKDLMKYIQPTSLDTLAMTRIAYPESSSYKLKNICKEVGINLKNAHNAMPDVIATTKLFTLMSNQMRQTVGATSVEDKVTKRRDKFQF